MDREDIIERIRQAVGPLLLELPTGYGKTLMAIKWLAARATTAQKTLVVVPKRVLMQTWREELKKWGYASYIPSIEFVTYMSYPKRAGEEYEAIIFDEAHHISERCLDNMAIAKKGNCLLLSATVNRDKKYAFMQAFHGLQTIKVGIRKAISDEVLPDPKVLLVPLKLDNRTANCEIVRNKCRAGTIFVEYKDRFLVAKIKDRQVRIKCTEQQYYDDISGLIEFYKKEMMRNKHLKNNYLQKSGERLKWLAGKKTPHLIKLQEAANENVRMLTFCEGILQTEVLGNCIHSKAKAPTRVLEDFNEGRINKISACAILDEGCNLVNCQVGVFGMLNSSERMRKQRLGRLLRHKDPIIIVPFFVNTREGEIVVKMLEDYNKELVKEISLDGVLEMLNNWKDGQ